MRDDRPRAVFLTGAGLSADSGVKTYRGEDGVYQGIRAEVLMSAASMRSRPEAVHRFCDDRRQELAGKEPNEAHRVIGRLMGDYGDRVHHFTQNVDGLSPDGTVELHGRLSRMRSVGNSHVTEDIGHARYWDGDPETAPIRGFQFRCPKTNSRYRPDVVLFDEPAPAYARLWRTIGRLKSHDVLVVIGTQGSVLPVTEFAREARCLTVLNNLHRSDDIDVAAFSTVFEMPASKAAAGIETLVRSRLS